MSSNLNAQLEAVIKTKFKFTIHDDGDDDDEEEEDVCLPIFLNPLYLSLCVCLSFSLYLASAFYAIGNFISFIESRNHGVQMRDPVDLNE